MSRSIIYDTNCFFGSKNMKKVLQPLLRILLDNGIYTESMVALEKKNRLDNTKRFTNPYEYGKWIINITQSTVNHVNYYKIHNEFVKKAQSVFKQEIFVAYDKLGRWLNERFSRNGYCKMVYEWNPIEKREMIKGIFFKLDAFQRHFYDHGEVRWDEIIHEIKGCQVIHEDNPWIFFLVEGFNNELEEKGLK